MFLIDGYTTFLELLLLVKIIIKPTFRFHMMAPWISNQISKGFFLLSVTDLYHILPFSADSTTSTKSAVL